MRRRASNNPDTSRDGFEICPSCGRDYVQPISWEPDGEARWWMFLRCAECGMSREVSVTNGEAERFEVELHARASIIARAVANIDRERMSSEIDRFVAALQRDLIDATDFAR